MKEVLAVESLKTFFFTPQAMVKAVDGVSFQIKRNEILGLVGESGCGKTVTGLSILRLIRAPGKIVSGTIAFRGVDLLKLPEDEMRKVRGREISVIFQDSLSSLDPVFTIGEQLSDIISLHQNVRKKEAQFLATEALEKVRIDTPVSRMEQYPHEISGGMRQRVMIAMAISCKPKLLIADEPTTALDVIVQAKILDLLNDIRRDMGLSVLLISHNMAVVANVCDRIAVMYSGKIMETAPARELIVNPKHPYTKGLIESIPKGAAESENEKKLSLIPGTLPRFNEIAEGCPFSTRCGELVSKCQVSDPHFCDVGMDHFVRCWKYA